MPERKRSREGTGETEDFVDDETGTPGQAGRAGGELGRRAGTRDEAGQAEGDAGPARVTRSDEKGERNLGGLHGTGDKAADRAQSRPR